MRKIVLNCKSLIMIFFVLTPFIEMINSTILINTGGESTLGKIYRMAYICILVYSLLVSKINMKHFVWLVAFLGVTIIPIIICCWVNDDEFITKLYNAIKYLLPILTLMVLQQLHSKKMIGNGFSKRVFEIYSWVLPISYFVPLLLGMGYYQYGNGRGYKGLNYMINDINIVVAIITIYSAKLLLRKRTFVNIIRFMLNIACLLYMQTKTSIVVAVAIIIFLFINLLRGRQAIQKFIIALVAFSVVISILYDMYETQIMVYFERLIYSYVTMTEQGYSFFEFFTTMRSSRLEDVSVLYNLNNSQGLVNLLFGLPTQDFINSEMDFFDILFSFGVFSFVYMIIFYGRYIVLAVKHYVILRSIDNLSALVEIGVILMFAAFGGHVLMSAYSGCVLALVCFEIYDQNE